jgi:hypothetical protein
MLGQNTRAARLFEVKVERREDGGALLQWKKIEDVRDWATLSAGCYLLRTNVLDWTDEDLWKTYMQLTEAEAAFNADFRDAEFDDTFVLKPGDFSGVFRMSVIRFSSRIGFGS